MSLHQPPPPHHPFLFFDPTFQYSISCFPSMHSDGSPPFPFSPTPPRIQRQTTTFVQPAFFVLYLFSIHFFYPATVSLLVILWESLSSDARLFLLMVPLPFLVGVPLLRANVFLFIVSGESFSLFVFFHPSAREFFF